jgi:hypothetical protein
MQNITLVHKIVRFLKELIFYTNNQTINYVFSFIIHDYVPTFGQVFDPKLEEIRRIGSEEVVEPILELNVVVEGNSA